MFGALLFFLLSSERRLSVDSAGIKNSNLLRMFVSLAEMPSVAIERKPETGFFFLAMFRVCVLAKLI